MQDLIKRVFDMVAAFIGIVVLSPVLLGLYLWVILDSSGGAFYPQIRVARGGGHFRVWKFRTMLNEQDVQKNDGITSPAKQARITKAGRVLRKYRLDELPQLFNVLIGDMSLVGPRPQIPKYIAIYPEIYARILTVRPGITGLATAKFHGREESLLAQAKTAQDAEDIYINKALPQKFRLDLFYIARRNFWLDLRIIFWTLASVLKK